MQDSQGGCICSRFAAVTEAAALAAAELLGRDDAAAADTAARNAMAAELSRVCVRGRVVAGRAAGSPDTRAVAVGSEVGREKGPWFTSAAGAAEELTDDPEPWDLAIDPLQAPNSLARGTSGALAMLAAGPAGSLMAVPEMYMQKLVVPSVAAEGVDLDAPLCDNLAAVAAALGRRPGDLTVVVLDRPRHEDLISQIRRCGARVTLINDGDISASLAVVAGDSGVDMCVGIGGSTEGILTAAILRCTGGVMQARFWPISRQQVEMLRATGIGDIEAKLASRDMVGEGVLVSATSVTGGRFLRAVDAKPYGIRTESFVFCSRCNKIRKIQTIHRLKGADYPVQLGAL
jgi:fructose-1,6-bisphosphatase II